MTKPNPDQIRSASGKVIGYVTGNVFHKYPLRASIHKMRQPPGWASDSVSLAQAKAKGAERVHIFDEENNIHYTASIALFLKYGVYIDRGHNVQMVLPDKWWTVENPNQAALFNGDAL